LITTIVEAPIGLIGNLVKIENGPRHGKRLRTRQDATERTPSSYLEPGGSFGKATRENEARVRRPALA